jgi:Putative sensor
VIAMGGFRLLVSAAPWRSAAYLLGSIVIGTVLFTVVVTVVAVSAPLVVIGIGLPLLLAAAHVIRGAAHLERQRAAMVPGIAVAEPPVDRAGLAGDDVEAPDAGLLAALRRQRTDPAMAPSLGYLVGLYVPLILLDTVAVGLWLGILGGVTIPFWYWAVPETFDGVTDHGLFWGSFPHGPGGPDAVGLAIDDLPTAIAVAAIFAVLFVVVACPLVVAAARLHARTAGRLLGRPADPVAPARAELRSPGPLAPLASVGPTACPSVPPHHLTLAPPAT